jgi:hypothetical protein
MSVAFANRVSNFGKTIENVIEKRAVDGYRNQQTTNTDSTIPTHIGSPSSGGASKVLKAQRDQYKINVGQRSPILTKSIEHTYGANNLPSDDMNAVMGNVYMQEAAL